MTRTHDNSGWAATHEYKRRKRKKKITTKTQLTQQRITFQKSRRTITRRNRNTNKNHDIPTTTRITIQSQIHTFIPHLTVPIVRRTTPSTPGPTLLQTNLHGDLISRTKHVFGHPQQPKTNNVYRVIGQNISNIPINPNKAKSKHLVYRASGNDSGDIRLWQEIGLDPRNLKLRNTWRTRLGKTRAHSVHAFNLQENLKNSRQWGGTMIISNQRIMSKHIGHGTDPLGRWAWNTFGNYHTTHTTFISAYRPCRNAGPTTVYQQQRRFFGTENIDPSKKFIEDLSEFINLKQAEGSLIIMSIDFNEDVRKRKFQQFLRDTGLHNPILETHGDQCPATCLRNDNKIPIDALVCSRGIQPRHCGYSKPNDGVESDHLQLWADFDKHIIFPHTEEFAPPKINKLNPKDVKYRTIYNDKSFEKCKEFLTPLRDLCNVEAGYFLHEQIKQYDTILAKITQIRQTIKNKLRHIYTGNHPWSMVPSL